MSVIHSLDETAGLVLAGGLSTRMGQDKAALSYLGKTLLSNAAQTLLEAGLTQRVISSNTSGDKVEALNDIEIVKDIYPNKGPLSGIHAALSKTENALIILPVDMPLVDAKMLKKLIKTGKATNKSVCYQDNILPLYLPFSNELFEYLEQSLSKPAPDKKLLSIKRLIRQIGVEELIPNEQEENKLFNVNTPEQWQQALTLLERQ